MNEKTRDQLDALLASNAKKVHASQVEANTKRQEEDSFLEEFKRLRAQVIRPVMQEFYDKLNGCGHDCNITEREEAVDPRRGTTSAQIELAVIPKGKKRISNNPYPCVSFSTVTYKKLILHYKSNCLGSGSAGPVAEHPLSAFTPEFVEGCILGMLKEIL
jgi:hypothetical protein